MTRRCIGRCPYCQRAKMLSAQNLVYLQKQGKHWYITSNIKPNSYHTVYSDMDSSVSWQEQTNYNIRFAVNYCPMCGRKLSGNDVICPDSPEYKIIDLVASYEEETYDVLMHRLAEFEALGLTPEQILRLKENPDGGEERSE